MYEWLISEAVARGDLSAPGFFSSPLVKAAYLECSWSGPIMGQLNPLDEANASAKRIETGVSTLEEETAEMTGGDDWERKHSQRVKEHRLRVDGGLEPAVLGAEGVATNPSTADQRDAQDAAQRGKPAARPPADSPPPKKANDK